MKKLILMGMLALGMTSFASIQENDNKLKEFIMDYQESQTVEMISREMPEDLNVTNIHEFFRSNLNNYDG